MKHSRPVVKLALRRVNQQILHEIGMALRGKGFSDSDIAKAKALRKLLNDAVLTDKGWDELRAAINTARNEKWFRDARVSIEWLEPNDNAFNERMRRNLSFDPLPFWEKVTCSVLAIYGELDSHTSAKESIAIIKPALMKARNKDYSFVIFPKSNHNFLEAETGYDDEFARLKRHSPGYFETLLTWILTRVDVPR